MVAPTVDDVVGAFVRTRDKIKALEAKHKTELAPLKLDRDQLAGWLIMKLKELGSGSKASLATASGTAYLSTKHSASVKDKSVFMAYIIENKLWDLLDRRANVTAVIDYAKVNKTLPPGVNLSSVTTVGVNRGDGKDEDSE